MVQVSTAVEVDDRLQGNLCGNILLLCSSLNLLAGSVKAVDVCLVVVLVVKLHDLAGDGWLECAIVVCVTISMRADRWNQSISGTYMGDLEGWLCLGQSSRLPWRKLWEWKL